MPFSDPLADGLTNQLAAQRALEAGMTSDRVFELVRALRADHPDTPIMFYTYYNVVFASGVDAYVRAAKAAGVDGLLTLDLPPEEAGEVLAASRAHDLKTDFHRGADHAGPPPPENHRRGDRLHLLRFARGRHGRCATRWPAASPRRWRASRRRRPCRWSWASASRGATRCSEVARSADGVVVGSALVNCIKENLGDAGRIVARLGALAAELAAGPRAADAQMTLGRGSSSAATAAMIRSEACW